jgi:hypothetical protein
VAETDHPYNTDSWIDDVTDGFEAAMVGLSPRVTCKTCGEQVLPKRSRDPNQLAKEVVDLATMDETERENLQRTAKKRAPATQAPKEGSTGQKRP